MRAKVTNSSKANQGIYTDEGLVHLEPGQSRTLTIADHYVERAKKLPFLKVEPVGDKAGKDDGGEKHLSQMNKAELLAVAEAEGVEVQDGATNAAIKDAIEAKRAEAGE